MDKKYKTIIIGAGPAGLIAGRHLEDALILDKKREIGKPVQCGEGISVEALKFQNIEPDPLWICCKIHKIERIMPNTKAMGHRRENPAGFIIDRVAFEKSLAQGAKCEIKLNSKVIDLRHNGNYWEVFTENGEVFRGDYLIGADGPASIVRQKVFDEKPIIVPAFEYLVKTGKKLDTETAKIYLDNEKYSNGYAWIFPKSENTANIGVGGKGNLEEKFNDFLESVVKKQYGSVQVLDNKSGAVALCEKNFKFFKNNVFLTGDAGGLTDPLFKSGMNRAMMSAKIAAGCILNNKANVYEEIINKSLFNLELIEAADILSSLDNKTLNELGEVFDGKGSSFLKTLPGFLKFASKPALRSNFFKLLKFFSIWRKANNYLW